MTTFHRHWLSLIIFCELRLLVCLCFALCLFGKSTSLRVEVHLFVLLLGRSDSASLRCDGLHRLTLVELVHSLRDAAHVFDVKVVVELHWAIAKSSVRVRRHGPASRGHQVLLLGRVKRISHETSFVDWLGAAEPAKISLAKDKATRSWLGGDLALRHGSVP